MGRNDQEFINFAQNSSYRIGFEMENRFRTRSTSRVESKLVVFMKSWTLHIESGVLHSHGNVASGTNARDLVNSKG